jgi:hypothetical protein
VTAWLRLPYSNNRRSIRGPGVDQQGSRRRHELGTSGRALLDVLRQEQG